MVGNGVTEPTADSTVNSLAPFAFGHGLISQTTWSKIQDCNGGETPTGTGVGGTTRGLAMEAVAVTRSEQRGRL